MTRPFIFVHIPKTGGQSISAALAGQPGQVPAPRRLPKRHPTALDWLLFLGPGVFCSAFRFAVVRNPWDRLWSFYRYGCRKLTPMPALFGDWPSFVTWVVEGPLSPSPEWNRAKMQQVAYLHDGCGRCIVGRIIRLEDIDTAWIPLCREIGIDPAPELPRRNVSPKRLDVSPWRGRHEELLEAVGEFFLADVTRFDYEPPRG